MVGRRADLLYEPTAPSEVLSRRRLVQSGEDQRTGGSRTLVTSLVAASISLSSADRSANPGSACFACSLSRVPTGREWTR